MYWEEKRACNITIYNNSLSANYAIVQIISSVVLEPGVISLVEPGNQGTSVKVVHSSNVYD